MPVISCHSRFGLLCFWAIGCSLAFLCAGTSTSADTAAEEAVTYYTWNVFEPDKCASIWLIKRFLEPDAVIRVVAKGEYLDEGMPLDIPGAKFSRTHNKSTFELLLAEYGIKNPALLQIGRLIHDMEINIWETKKYKQTRKLQIEINTLIQEADQPEEIILKTMDYFDDLYENVMTEG